MTNVGDRGQVVQAAKVLVGRATEPVAIESLLRDAECGTAGAVLFRGPPGVGTSVSIAPVSESA